MIFLKILFFWKVTPCNWVNVTRRFGRSLLIVLVVTHRCKENLNFAYRKIDLNFYITTGKCAQMLYHMLLSFVVPLFCLK